MKTKIEIDLSPKNVAKTILYDDLLAQDLQTNKKYIGVLITDKYGDNIKIFPKRFTLKEFKKTFKDRKVLSTHEYSEYLSVVIERLYS